MILLGLKWLYYKCIIHFDIIIETEILTYYPQEYLNLLRLQLLCYKCIIPFEIVIETEYSSASVELQIASLVLGENILCLFDGANNYTEFPYELMKEDFQVDEWGGHVQMKGWKTIQFSIKFFFSI